MKKSTKTMARHKGTGRRSKHDSRPLELDRGWHELEQQHDRLKSDWSSLAAQLGIGGESDRTGFD
jgi:hypothetical protein